MTLRNLRGKDSVPSKSLLGGGKTSRGLSAIGTQLSKVKWEPAQQKNFLPAAS